MSSIPRETIPPREFTSPGVKNTKGIGGFFANISGIVGKIAEDVGDLVTLRIDLLKVELRDGARTIASNSIYVLAGGLVALFALAVITTAIIVGVAAALPWSPLVSVAVAALIIGVIYSIAAFFLIRFGIEHFKKRSVKPEQSIREVWKDKEWMQDIQKSAKQR